MIAHFIVAGKHCDAPLSMFEPHVTFAPLHLFFHLPTVWGRGIEDRSPPLDLIVFGPLRPCCAPTARCGLLLFNIYTAPGVNLQNKMGKTVHYCFFSSFFFWASTRTSTVSLFSESKKRMKTWAAHDELDGTTFQGDAPTDVIMIKWTGKSSTYKIHIQNHKSSLVYCIVS